MHRFENFHFKGQEQGEEIIKIVRRHWFDILQQFIIIMFLVIALIAGAVIVPSLLSDFLENGGESLTIFIETTMAIMIWLVAFIIWIDFYFDVWIITNKRIVNIEQRGLFVRRASELKFSRIQDVTTEVSGLIPTVLNYGEVYVQTAGAENRFLFHRVPDPYGIKSLVMDLQQKSNHH